MDGKILDLITTDGDWGVRGEYQKLYFVLLAINDIANKYGELSCHHKALADRIGMPVAELESVIEKLMELGLVEWCEFNQHDAGNASHLTTRLRVLNNKNRLRPNQYQWSLLRQIVFERDDYTCVYCGTVGVDLQCDHVQPVSKGGSNELDNLATACRSCNLSKSDRTDWELAQ